MFAHAGHHISLSQSVLLQVLVAHFFLGEHLHGQQLFILLALNEKYFAEASVSEQLMSHKVFRAEAFPLWRRFE